MNNQTIAYQGVGGAYSHLSCKNVFPQAETIACESFKEAMYLVETGVANFAMIPVENSTAGRVEEIYRLIPKMELTIINEHFEPIKHCLLGLKDSNIKDIKYVSSHPQALAQCLGNITKRKIEAIAKFDTAGAAQELTLMKDKAHAAIASSLSAELYDLNILDDNFGDHHGNITRFLILGKNNEISEYIENEKYQFHIAMNNDNSNGDPEIGLTRVVFINRKSYPVTMSIHMNFSGMGSSGTGEFEISGRHNYLSVGGRAYKNEIGGNFDDTANVFTPIQWGGAMTALGTIPDSSYTNVGMLANLGVLNFTFMPGQYLKLIIPVRGAGRESCVISGYEV